MQVFERFTSTAREIVRSAAAAAERDRTQVGNAHLLVAMSACPTGRRLLDELGATPTLVDDALQAARQRSRRAGIRDEEVEALRSIGIDLDQVIASVESRWGHGALAAPAAPRARSPWRRVAPTRFTDEAKSSLERSLREGLELGDRHLGVEQLLLGLLAGSSPLADALTARGVSYLAARALITRRRSA